MSGPPDTSTSLSRELCVSNVDAVAERLSLTEVTHEGGAYDTLTSEMMPEPVGDVRLFEGAVTLIYVGMTVPMIQLDSHMMFAFTPPESAVPHFTVDSVQNADAYAFHLDMIPRLDLGANLAYMDHCYGPLTETRKLTLEMDGLIPADLAPRQWALMSEWMLANHCEEATFKAIRPTVDTYRQHWFGLVENGIPSDLLDGAGEDARVTRDERNRRAIFDPDVDRVWAQVERLVGREQSEATRKLLASAGTERTAR
jgi:hypothetical protein